MMPALFKSPKLVKVAEPEGGQLPPNVAEWPMRIRDEWAKMAPYAWEYPTEVVLSEKDDQRGYGFGHIILTSKTGLSPAKAEGQMGARYGIKTAKVPVIIEDFKLYPLDLIVNEEGAILPLNESRLREALFRPTTFDAPGKHDGTGMFGAVLYPPMREYGANNVSNAVSKIGSYPILQTILDTVTEDQVDRIADLIQKEKLAGDIAANPALAGYLRLVNSAEHRPVIRTMDDKLALLRTVTPDVLMVVRGSDADEQPVYHVKIASRGMYYPQEDVLDRGQALRYLGEEKTKEADLKGMVIIIRRRAGQPEPSILDSIRGPAGELEGEGPCMGMGSDGGGFPGHLISKILSLVSGDRLPLKLMSDGKSFGMQESIGGVPAPGEKSTLEETDTPVGTGVFTWTGSDGTTSSSEPVTVKTSVMEDGRKQYVAETMAGKEIRIVLSDAAKDVSPSGDGLVLLPSSAVFKKIGEKIVKLGTAVEVRAFANVKLAASVEEITFSDGLFNFSGPPLRKLGNLAGKSAVDALFLCGVLGLSKEASEKALAMAFRRGSTKIAGALPVVPLEEVDREIQTKVASAVKENLELPILLKEAASLGDPQAVDAILSLGFLNLDNISRAITFLPHFEGIQKKLGIMLLQARLGLSELPSDHISRALSAIEHVIAGLRRVSLRLAPMGAVS